MKIAKIITSFILAGFLLLAQVAVAFAAPLPQEMTYISGEVVVISVKPDVNTGISTVFVTLRNAGVEQTVRISEQDAAFIGLVYYEDAGPLPDEEWLGYWLDIEASKIIPDPVDETPLEPQHPVGSTLATFFSDIDGLNYKVIMEAHTNGTGFGVIAQALWLTRKLEGNVDVFTKIINAKKEENFSDFTFNDGSSPMNWGQFRKAVLGEDKKGNLGLAMSQKDKDKPGNSSNANANNPENNKDKNKDKSNNGGANDKGNDKNP